MRLTSLVICLCCVMGLVATRGADAGQFLVRAGDDWSQLKPKLRPGDEIILMPGNHRAARFEDLAGEEGKPITIRSADPKRISTVTAADIGIHLIRPKHIHIEKLAIIGGKRGGIIIAGDTTSRAERISIVDVYVSKTGDEGEQSGVRLERTDHATLKNCRIEAWHRAGVHVHASTDIALTGVQFVASPGTADEYGAIVDGASASVIFQQCRFGFGVATAIALGSKDTGAVPAIQTTDPPSKPAELPVLAEGITVERCLAKRNGTFISFGSCSGVLVRANTLVDCGTAYEVTEPPTGYGQVRSSTFLANLITWSPSAMKSFCVVRGGAEPKGLVLEANLWYSLEISLAKEALGEFKGTIKSDQIVNVDPKLDGYDRPQEEKAKGFGWSSV
jgi:hypothetical protein